MSDIFQDVEEELRRERLKKTWTRALPWICGLAALAVIATGIWSGLEWHKSTKSAEASIQYQNAIDLAQKGKFSEADTIFMDLAQNGPKGYAALSRFRHASIDAIVEPSKGLERFDALSNDESLSQILRDLASIRSSQILLDKGSYQEIETRIQKLAENPSNAWRHSAREILALGAWKIGNEEAARRWGEMVLSDFSAPRGTRGRAQLVLDLVGDAKPVKDAARNRKQTPAEESAQMAPAAVKN